MTDPVVLDTDVASKSFKRELPPTLLRQLIGRHPVITFVTLAEMTHWMERRRWGRQRRDLLNRWLDGIAVIPGTDDVARMWGEISARAVLRGQPRPQNDTWIAACCLTTGLPLATLNMKDFEVFADHDGLTIVSS
ncbi:PIN domain-containing protein [Kibdelosporangium philippinense]|uniref:PIN domain-containing protein n=1 Tax=Kibdelosporangium philippinense TaxID=211113 RepID=A0ABS8ZCU4_9PSEU|nr:PIN domain-containing protein [Kibdelosporangium philippinense]MCE7005670.1 PIN domain-containing protein [Kibdelosporangium philippinense]